MNANATIHVRNYEAREDGKWGGGIKEVVEITRNS